MKKIIFLMSLMLLDVATPKLAFVVRQDIAGCKGGFPCGKKLRNSTVVQWLPYDAPSSEFCPEPGKEMPNLGCVTPLQNQIPWEEAKLYCEDKGEQLLQGFTKDDLELISVEFPSIIRAWAGIRNMTWVNGTTLSADSPVWNDDEPDGGDMCGAIHLIHEGSVVPHLDDKPCQDSRYVICQKFK